MNNVLDGVPSTCIGHVTYIVEKKSGWDPNWYTDMQGLIGVNVYDASLTDAQRYIMCKTFSDPQKKADCNDNGLQFPSTCSCPPCDKCSITSCEGRTKRL